MACVEEIQFHLLHKKRNPLPINIDEQRGIRFQCCSRLRGSRMIFNFSLESIWLGDFSSLNSSGTNIGILIILLSSLRLPLPQWLFVQPAASSVASAGARCFLSRRSPQRGCFLSRGLASATGASSTGACRLLAGFGSGAWRALQSYKL